MICLMRTAQVGLLVFAALVGIGTAIALGVMIDDIGAGIAIVALFIGGLMLLVGGRSVRNDLRSDMLHLPFLKAIPISGMHIVVAEIASGAVVMAAIEFVLLTIAVAGLAWSTNEIPVSPEARLGILVASPVALLAYNGVVFTVLNGAAVLFPAWMRLGPSGGGGVEAMGQIVLATAGQLFAQVLLLLAPIGIAAGTVYMLRGNAGLAFAVGLIAGGLALMAELYFAVRGLGRAFGRAEPQQIT